MPTVRISDSAYEYLNSYAKRNMRSFLSTLDLFVKLVKEANDAEGLEDAGISSEDKEQGKVRGHELVADKKARYKTR